MKYPACHGCQSRKSELGWDHDEITEAELFRGHLPGCIYALKSSKVECTEDGCEKWSQDKSGKCRSHGAAAKDKHPEKTDVNKYRWQT